MSQESTIVQFDGRRPVSFDPSKLEWLQNGHAEQLALCKQLEEIADGLPSDINRVQCLNVAKALPPLMRRVHDFEENSLFPWLENNLPDRPELADTINRLKFEHVEDECFAEELLDLLHKLGNGGKPSNPEAAGYMLRGFFEGVRRHIAFEREHLLGLVATVKN